MTYEEIKNKLSICEKALNSLKTTGYKKATKEETKLKIQEIKVLKEGLEKRLLEADSGTVRTDDEAKAEKLAKKGVNVQLTEEDEGVQFDQNQTAQAAVIVGKATAKALVAAGEELASMRVIRIQPNSFDVKAVFKGEKGEDEYSFYISNNKLNIADFNSNKEIADVGVQPSGGPLVNGDIVSNELQKHFRSLSEANVREGYDANDDLDSMDFSKLNPGQRAAFDVWIVQYAEGYFDNKADFQDMIDKFAEVENAYDLEDFVHADFAGDKGERQIFIRQLIKAYLDDDQPLDEGEGDDHHYIKVPKAHFKKAEAIIAKNIDGNNVKMDYVDNDGAGNAIIYFMFKDGDIASGEASSFMHDAVMDLEAYGIRITDHSAEMDESRYTKIRDYYKKIDKLKGDQFSKEEEEENPRKPSKQMDELDANDPILMRLRAKAMQRKKDSERSNFDPRGIDQEEAMDLRMRLKDLEEEREDILRNMEQEAEPEGGPIADDYGSILNDIDEKIYRVKKQIHQYDMNESPMTMAYTKIVKPKKTNEESVARIQKAYDVLIDNMKELGKKYNAGDKSLIGQLKNLTKQKKYLEKSLQDKVANIGKNQKLDELSVDKEDALDELREILGRVQDYGEQAREIIRQEFPNYLSKGDSYGVFNMGSSFNRYDTTLESMIDGIERHYEEEEDMEEGKYKSDAQRKAIHATKAEKNENIKEGRGDLDTIVRVITDMANEDGTSTKEAAEEIIDALKDAYQIKEQPLDEADLEKGEKKQVKKIVGQLKKSVKGHGDQAKYLSKLVKEGTELYDDNNFQFKRFAAGQGKKALQVTARKLGGGGFDYIQIPGDKVRLFAQAAVKSASLFNDMKYQGADADTLESAPGYKHDCAAKVVHEKYGPGNCIHGQHTLVKEGTKHVVTHYDVFFKKDNKTVKNIPVNELKIVTMNEHWHKNYKKKSK